MFGVVLIMLIDMQMLKGFGHEEWPSRGSEKFRPMSPTKDWMCGKGRRLKPARSSSSMYKVC